MRPSLSFATILTVFAAMEPTGPCRGRRSEPSTKPKSKTKASIRNEQIT